MPKGIPGSGKGKPVSADDFRGDNVSPPLPAEAPEIIAPGTRDKSTKSSAEMPEPGKTGFSGQSKGKTGPKPKVEQVKSLAGQIFGIHQMAAMVFQSQALMITEGQAISIADPLLDVAKKYHIPLTAEGWPELQLLATCAAIYFPMMIGFKMEMAARQAKSAHPEDNPPPGDPSAATSFTPSPEQYGPFPPGGNGTAH